MTSWLGSAVADKLGDAVAYKTAQHNHVKPEPFLLQDVIENGSNLKVRMNMPSVSLHVLKVGVLSQARSQCLRELQGQVLIITDGAVSMQARVSPHAKEQFQNQYKCSLSFVENKTITSTISDITHTTFGSPPSRVQLLLSSFTISNTTMIIDDSRILPIHSIDRIKVSMYRLKQSYQPTAESPTSIEAAIPVPNSTDNADLEMVEAPSNASDHVERTTSLKRLHSQSSPSQSSSHRLVRPRIYQDNDDVSVQTGLNLHQPVQLQSNNFQEPSRLLSLLSSRASAARASASTDREQALRLGSRMHVQMAPPPVPAAKISNVQTQILSQPLSQPLSQNFESQIPMVDVTIPEPSARDNVSKDTSIVEPQPEIVALNTQPRVDKAEVDGSPNHIPSSPPSGSVSQERDDLEIEDLAQSQPNSRQLPEYPLSSPEDDFPASSFEAEPEKSEKQSPLGKSVNHNRASSPILEVAASPETREGIEKEFTARVQTLKNDESSVPQILSHTNITPPILERPQLDDDIVVNDQPPAKDNLAVEKQPQDIVADSPRPQPRRDRRSGWGLEETAETHAQRRNRIRREFIEQRRRETTVAGIGVSVTHVTQATAQLGDENEGNQELPILNTEPQPDPMDVDEPLVDLPQPVDDSTAKRANIVGQWRRQSGQEDGNPVTEASMVKSSGVVASNSTASEHAVSVPPTFEATAPGSPMHSGRSLPPNLSRCADRQVLDSDSGNSLPSRPLHHADMQTKYQIRQEIEDGVFGEPTRALWVGSLPASIDNRQLEQMFAEFDPISASSKKKSGFVNFADIDTACRALEAKHKSLFDEHRVVCNFASPRGPASDTPTNLTVDDLFRQFVNKHNFKGNRTAFERLCKKLHTSSDIPLAQWDNYVVLYPAEFLPFANRTVANGEEVPEYDTYWHQQLGKTAKPNLVPVLTPAKLNAVFNQAPAVTTPSAKPSVPVTPQTTSGASRQPSKQMPSPASSIVSRAIPDNLRRSVVERNTQNTASTPPQAASHHHDPFSNMLEPRRTSEWLRQNFTKDPQGRVVQSELYQKYKKDCSNATVPWMPGGPFVDHVFNTFHGGRTMSEVDDKGNKIFYCTGLRYKSSARSTPTNVGAPEFKIRGISASNPSGGRSHETTSADRSAQREFRLSSLGEREGRLGRSLPFMEQERRLSRSRSPPRNPPPRAPRGKPSSTDHLLIREGLDADSEKPEYRDFYKKYRSLGNVTKKGNAFSERE
ncbi:hypothetical protein E4T48_04434 [Aureobasidium sp. EXF-10727]|nr:hypothetical protein E4T48_04434 [Aureobasidium sp. EXF-10727]